MVRKAVALVLLTLVSLGSSGCTSQQTDAMLCGPSIGGWPSTSYGPADIAVDALMLAGCAAKNALK
jgi:hypothetical protein